MSYTDERLSADLGVDIATLRKAIARKGYDVDKGETLNTEVVEVIAKAYARPHAKRDKSTELAAKKILAEIKGEKTVLIPVAAPEIREPKRTTVRASTGKKKEQPVVLRSKIDDFFRSRWLLFTVFLLALLFQMEHSALVAAKVSQLENKSLGMISGIVFAVAVQFTGLIMTIHKGSKDYLVAFAVIEFFINMLYYAPWSNPDAGFDVWAIDIIISAAIAFTIFSYAELFAKPTMLAHD